LKLENIAEKILKYLDAKNAAREEALVRSRELIRYSANAIRAVHREEDEEALRHLAQARELAARLRDMLAHYPDLYHAGYTQDAFKEMAEAHITYALIKGRSLPDPDELGVEYAAYLNGLGEAMGELRRRVLDLIRRDELEEGERILSLMDEVYGFLISVDFPEVLTGRLRRTTDMVRGVLERTRGDLTMATQQDKLRRALQRHPLSD